MQQAVLRHFPNADATYRFTHRDKDVHFTRLCYERYLNALSRTFRLGETVRMSLRKAHP